VLTVLLTNTEQFGVFRVFKALEGTGVGVGVIIDII
jgi:hypothetical protein